MWGELLDVRIDGKGLSPEGRAIVEAELAIAERMMAQEAQSFGHLPKIAKNPNAWRTEIPRATEFMKNGTVDLKAFFKASEDVHTQALVVAKILGEKVIPSRIVESNLAAMSSRSIGHTVEKAMGGLRASEGQPKIPTSSSDLFARMESSMKQEGISPESYSLRKIMMESWIQDNGMDSNSTSTRNSKFTTNRRKHSNKRRETNQNKRIPIPSRNNKRPTTRRNTTIQHKSQRRKRSKLQPSKHSIPKHIRTVNDSMGVVLRSTPNEQTNQQTRRKRIWTLS